jgi:hypothetical protein
LKIKEFQLSQVLGIEMNQMELGYQELLKYVKDLEIRVKSQENSSVFIIFLIILAGFLFFLLWKMMGIESFLLTFEHILVLLFAKDGKRIENILTYPLITLNICIIFYNISLHPLSKFKSNSFSISLLKYKFQDCISSNPSFLISLISLYFLLTQAKKFNPTQDFSQYYTHFLIFQIQLFFHFSTLTKFKRYLSLFSIWLLLLILYYELITDYSMTDQTKSMIKTSRLFYLSLLFFTFFTVLHPNKRQILPVPLSILYFFIASQDQRSFLVFFFLPSLSILIHTNKAKEILILGVSSYILMFGTFGFDISLRAGNHSWGVNPDDFPIFTGFLFGVHKFAWLMIAGSGIAACEGFERLVVPLVLRGLLAVVVFFIVFLAEPNSALSAFMWCMAQNLSMIVSHSLAVLPEVKKWTCCRRKEKIEMVV